MTKPTDPVPYAKYLRDGNIFMFEGELFRAGHHEFINIYRDDDEPELMFLVDARLIMFDHAGKPNFDGPELRIVVNPHKLIYVLA